MKAGMSRQEEEDRYVVSDIHECPRKNFLLFLENTLYPSLFFPRYKGPRRFIHSFHTIFSCQGRSSALCLNPMPYGL